MKNFAIVVLLLAGCSRPPETVPQMTSEEKPSTGVLKGRVTLLTCGGAYQDEALANNDEPCSFSTFATSFRIIKDEQTVKEVNTNVDATFEVQLPAGSYVMSFQSDQCNVGYITCPADRTFQIVAGETHEEIPQFVISTP